MKNRFNLKFYNNIKRIINKPFKLIFNPIVSGLENIKDKPYILIGNHKSIWDIPLLISIIDDDIHFMAKKELFDHIIIKDILYKMGAFPISRDTLDIEAIKKSLSLLRSGNVLCIFPEGTRNKTNDVLLPFKSGIEKLALKTNSLIIPFGISGNYCMRSNIKINIGHPIDVTKLNIHNQNKFLEDKVKELILK